MINEEFSMFRNVGSKTPMKTTLQDFIEDLRKPNERVDALRAMPDTTPEEHAARQEYKRENLRGYTVSAVCKGGHASGNVVRHSALVCVDFDVQDNRNVKDFDKLKDNISQLPFIVLCAKSCGGEGFFAVARITSPDRHDSQYDALMRVFACAGLKCDAGCRDITRLRYETYDAEPYVNMDAEPFGYYLPTVGEKKTVPERKPTATYEDAVRVMDCIREAKRLGVALSDDRDTWMRMAFAFATSFGEDGRFLFDEFSKLSPKYGQVDQKFDEALRSGRGDVTLGSFIKLCRDNNVMAALDFESIDV